MSTTPRPYRRRGYPPADRTVLAWQVTETNLDDVAAWCRGRVEHRLTVRGDIRVRPGHCTTAARIGDYVAQAAEGDWWYPVKQLLFELYYEPVDEEA